MYGPPHSSMNDSSNIQHLQHHQQGTSAGHIEEEEEEEDEDVHCINGEDSISDNPPTQIGYDPVNNSHALCAIEGTSSHALYASDMAPPAAPSGGESAADQLTLTFQGQVYVFDSVSPEKVQAVLLLLGGYELPTGISNPGMAPQTHRNLGEYPMKSSQPQRAASLNRFREKRKERCFDKKIRYTVRKEVALRMQRKKGQFTSSKSVAEEPGSSSADWNGSSGQEEQETTCRHCGISSKSTPMMRRGPDGPRTLCNACGLKWANKGILREISKLPIVGVQHHHPMQASDIVRDFKSEARGESTVILPSSNGES